MTTLGHVQRGGAPGAFDRLLARGWARERSSRSRQGHFGVLVGQVKGEITTTPLDDVVGEEEADRSEAV